MRLNMFTTHCLCCSILFRTLHTLPLLLSSSVWSLPQETVLHKFQRESFSHTALVSLPLGADLGEQTAPARAHCRVMSLARKPAPVRDHVSFHGVRVGPKFPSFFLHDRLEKTSRTPTQVDSEQWFSGLAEVDACQVTVCMCIVFTGLCCYGTNWRLHVLHNRTCLPEHLTMVHKSSHFLARSH